MNGDKQPDTTTGEIRLGGRIFVTVNYAVISSINEHYIFKLMRETGLDRVVPVGDDESDQAYLSRLHTALIDTLQTHELIAGYLLPMGKGESDWSLKLAAETARFLKALQSPDDKAEINRLAMAAIFDFFRQGLDSLNDSQRSFESVTASPSDASQTSQTEAH